MVGGSVKKLIWIFVFMFVGVNGVKAESVSIDDLISNFDKTELVKAYNQIGSSISLTKDESNNKLNVIFDEEVSGSYSYTDEYVEYDNRDVEVTEENCMGNLSDILYMVSIMESIFISSGYEGKTISDDMPVDISYDEYGIVIETEPYSFESTDEDGGAVSNKYPSLFGGDIRDPAIDNGADLLRQIGRAHV